MNTAERERLFALLDAACTAQQISDLLREFKPLDKEIRVSGNSEELLQSVRRAVDRGTVPLQRVLRLLARAEENGRQHIFYYKPRTRVHAVKYNDGDSVAQSLFGENWAASEKFPRFYLEPHGMKWADFRVETVDGTDYHSWTLKVYNGRVINRFLGESRINDNRFSREYERVLTREVWLVRWHSFGLLEFRIPSHDRESRRTCLGDLEIFWDRVAQGIRREDFVEWDLGPVRNALVQNAEKRASEYRLGNAQFVDSRDGSAQFNPAYPEESLFDAPARRSAVALFRECSQLVVYWKPPKGQTAFNEEIRTEIGGYKSNGIRIGARTTPEAVNHVTLRLREF